MRLGKFLMTSTAILGLSTGMALADDNAAWLDQLGDGNSALVQQDGSNNRAGSSNPQRRMLQDGEDNALTVSQSGLSHRLGTGPRSSQGVNQTGNNNVADIDQSGAWGFVNQVQQTATGGSAGNANVLSITQQASAYSASGNQVRWSNVVSNVTQTNTGGADNTVTILQDRTNSGGPGGQGANVIASQGVGGNNSDHAARIGGGVFQDGTDNTATLTQLGDRNLIREVNQEGDGNNATVLQDGRRNGAALSGAADAVGATRAAVLQTGTDNAADIQMLGNDNGFGITQNGTNNQAVNIVLQGNDNLLGVNQVGVDNTLNLGTVLGNGNNVGVEQQGNTNTAGVSITGDDNGSGLGFTGDALTAAGTLESGIISQMGDLNSATLTVTGNTNAFTLASIGDNNEIFGTMNGNNHQAAVVQTGNGNLADFTQAGAGNNLGIIQ